MTKTGHKGSFPELTEGHREATRHEFPFEQAQLQGLRLRIRAMQALASRLISSTPLT